MIPEYIVDEEGQWGQVFDNWTGPGVYGNLAQDNGDVGLGALYIWEGRYRFFDMSQPVARSGVTCIVKAPRLASDLGVPFLSFSKEMWIMSGLSYLLISFSLSLFSMTAKIKDNDKNKISHVISSFVIAGRILLLQGYQKVPSHNISKIIVGMALIFSLFLTMAYSGGFSSIMAIPRYYGTIRDINDFVEANIQWGATSTAWISSLDTDTEVFTKVVNSFVVENEENLLKLNEDEEFAYAIERLQAGNFAIGSYITLEGAQKRRILDKDIYWNYCILMVRKNSILLPYLNKVINTVAESGLNQYWERQVVYRHMDTKTQKAIKYSSTTTPGSLTTTLALENIAGVFFIWTVGLLISTCVFIAEIILKK